jgi:outer membrane murein-binding lipoprotein Lpp
MGRMATLEKAVARLEQSNSELSDDVRAAMAESKRRSAALDNLARLLLASDAGVMLLKKSSKAT